MKIEITPELIAALATLRNYARHSSVAGPVCDAIDALDNAGVFRPVDEATGYDVDPEPEQISKCDCGPVNG